ncbi:MAG: hypothetical protein PHD67_04330 [Oscillospiraceae bacterium]|nr:hypothetical protein [Oscillospiraceae bacterium]
MIERSIREKIAEISSSAAPELALLIKNEIYRMEKENAHLAGAVYTLSEEDALKCIEKAAGGRAKRIFQIALASVLALAFLISYLMDTAYVQGLILCLVCIGLLVVILVVPKRMQRELAKAQSGRERFLLAGDKDIFSSDGESCFQLSYEKDLVKIKEDEDFYLICASRNRNWCIPKAELTREALAELDEVFCGEESPLRKND